MGAGTFVNCSQIAFFVNPAVREAVRKRYGDVQLLSRLPPRQIGMVLATFNTG